MWCVVCTPVAPASCAVPQAPQAPPRTSNSNKGGKPRVCGGRAVLCWPWRRLMAAGAPHRAPSFSRPLSVMWPPGLPALCSRRAGEGGDRWGTLCPPPLASPLGRTAAQQRGAVCAWPAPTLPGSSSRCTAHTLGLRGGQGGPALGHPLFRAPHGPVTQCHFTFRPLTALFPNKHLGLSFASASALEEPCCDAWPSLSRSPSLPWAEGGISQLLLALEYFAILTGFSKLPAYSFINSSLK